ncbi:hypothetical protein [Streptomyces regalis]|uniref:Nickel/cobalt efflux system n=1 Tax=Streptomyces regalis TaxID=68262 RepID=A0A0X3VPB4_9ACTN|nr:hypothetical protein [Streptomyces regalis]KUL45416.1 hypothetical protein ADL12_03490 [Streptomyces regalis]
MPYCRCVARGIVRTWREAKAGRHQPEELEELLADRGLMNRVLQGRSDMFIEHGWQLYFVGLLFGLGFDTATQVGALGMAAGSAADGTLLAQRRVGGHRALEPGSGHTRAPPGPRALAAWKPIGVRYGNRSISECSWPRTSGQSQSVGAVDRQAEAEISPECAAPGAC